MFLVKHSISISFSSYRWLSSINSRGMIDLKKLFCLTIGGIMVHLKWIKQEIEAEKLLSMGSWVISVKFGKVAIGIYTFPKINIRRICRCDFRESWFYRWSYSWFFHGLCCLERWGFLSYLLYCGKIYLVFSWNWVFVQHLNKNLSSV